MTGTSSPTDAVTPEHIMQVGLGFWASKALLSAVELGLFTELEQQPGTAEELQGRRGLHPRSARGVSTTRGPTAWAG